METFNTLNLENVKSYATIDNLEKALVKNGLDNLKPILVGVPTTTRVTAREREIRGQRQRNLSWSCMTRVNTFNCCGKPAISSCATVM